MIQPATTISCKNCGHLFTGKYCNECGEKVYTEHDRSSLHFLEEGFHFITHFEGTFFTTVKTLFTKPGQVSVDYTFGIRKRYFRLLSLYLLVVVLYLLFPYFEGMNQQLRYHVQSPVYGSYAMKKTVQVMKSAHYNQEQMAAAFHKVSEKASKYMLVVLIPLTALAFWPVTYRKRKYSFDQMVFATEINSIYLIWGFLIVPFLLMCAEWIHLQLTGSHFVIYDGMATLALLLVPIAVFVFFASKRFYELSTGKALLFTLYFVLIHSIIVQIVYKFILFVTVINQIH